MSEWKDVEEHPLVNHIVHEDDYAELEILEDDYKIMACLITMSKYSGQRSGEKFWEYHIAKVDEYGDLVTMTGEDIGMTWEAVNFWKDKPEEPYKV